MNARRIALILVALLALLAFAVPAASDPEDEIVVEGADVILKPPVSTTQPPIEVNPRVVAQYSNHVGRMSLAAMPVPPQVPERVVVEYANALLREGLVVMPVPPQVPERVVVNYANALLKEDLVAMPVLPPLAERIAFQYANANLRYALDYPLELINDLTPPEISEIACEISGSSTISITWITDEFADSEVLYGEQSGQYPYTASDPLYVKEHEVGLTDLTPGSTCIYKVRSTDLSGNAATSAEHSCRHYIYLPLVTRKSP